MTDNQEIEPSDTLYRWLHPSQYHWEKRRPTSAAFTNTYMSVDISKLTTLEESYERAKKYDKNAVVSFEAKIAMEKEQEIVHCPTHIIDDSNPGETTVCKVRDGCDAYSENASEECLICINNAHGCVIGKKKDSVKKALARACKVEIYPPSS